MTIMKWLFYIFMVIYSSILSAEQLHIVGDDNAKPKNWIDTNGQPTGIMIDLLEEVTRRTGIEFTYSLAPWNHSLNLSSRGEGAIIGLSKTKQREETWDYSEPMFFDELSIVTLKTRVFEFSGLESLTGKKLAIKRGASYGDDFEAAKISGTIETIETIDRAGQLRMLTLNRVDAILLSPGRFALDAAIAENDWLISHQGDFEILTPPYKQDPNFMGIPKSMNKSYLLPQINNALQSIVEDGTHQKIVELNLQKLVSVSNEK